MSSKSSSSQPTAPDPTATANTQLGYNTTAAETQANLNRITQNNNTGSLSYSQTGTNSDGTPIYSQNETLSPTAQAAYTQANTIAGQLGGNATANSTTNPGIQGSLDYSSLGALPTAADFASQGQQAQQAAYNQSTSMLNPQWTNNDNDLNSSLAAQGISNNSAAYTRAQTQESDAKSYAYNQAQNSAIATGDTQQNALQQQALQDYSQGASNITNQGTYANQAQNQGYSQASGISSLLSGLSTPTFQSTPQVGVAAPDYSTLTEDQYNAQLQQYNAQQAAQSSMLGSIFGAAGTVGAAYLGA